ncbi:MULTISPECIES: questin oxidase family protein [Kitasatospora]|uniref:DUF4243 domain-containing protein n=1 Tax=Kitasatospora setae (strain ATCC 33774 / DSM 43861 / JCM 3304 / KCC A-0304 / NBRC 14216 / KM-6054) TaxID=452652 RepID=E4N4Q5_KITSK|nr:MULTISPECIES: questin oxidase family protein [Kitasatospora]BAJ26186.1 hypothetical protein KSE_03390 [Kitasatospora setae KM-6054]
MDTVGDSTGTLDEALQRLHACGPERLGRLTNHAPMAVEALAARGRADAVHGWLDRYADRLEEFPARVEPIAGPEEQRRALGDPRRIADWIDHFGRELAEQPWRAVLARWWPVLLPGLYGGSTHPVIRVGHAVRSLSGGSADGTASGTASGPRLAELAHGLGYWAARHRPLAVPRAAPLGPPVTGSAAAALDAVPPIAERTGGFPQRLERVTALPDWTPAGTGPDEVRQRLAELVRAATHRYATHGHGEPTMLVHAATAPNAVLRVLPALPPPLWGPSLRAAWTASAAVTAMYAPTGPDAPTGPEAPDAPPATRRAASGVRSAEEVLERALAHGDEHVVKLTDTALDVGDPLALAAALRAVELSEPLGRVVRYGRRQGGK